MVAELSVSTYLSMWTDSHSEVGSVGKQVRKIAELIELQLFFCSDVGTVMNIFTNR